MGCLLLETSVASKPGDVCRVLALFKNVQEPSFFLLARGGYHAIKNAEMGAENQSQNMLGCSLGIFVAIAVELSIRRIDR